MPFSHIINDENNHNLKNSENEEFRFENEVEIISAKSVKKTYEFYFRINLKILIFQKCHPY